MIKLVILDLNGTIAENNSPIDEEMALLLKDLTNIMKVAVISEVNWNQLQIQVIEKLIRDTNFKNLSILPSYGTHIYGYKSDWKRIYSDDLIIEDIAESDIDKVYGIQQLKEIFKIKFKEMIFIGNAVFSGGNDFPITKTEVKCINIDNLAETKKVIEAIIACMDDKGLTTFRDMERLMGD